MRIGVTGANGLLGSHLCLYLERAGHEVVRLQRGASGPGRIQFDLDRVPEAAALARLDALVHCAHDFSVAGWDAVKRTNVDGSISLIRTASQAGVGKIAFISSISAFAGCKSDYGRGKLAVEEAVLNTGGAVLRPGLIYGDARGRGMFGALERLTRLPVLPLFGGGQQPLYPAHIDDLVAFIALVLSDFERARGRVLYGASTEPIALRQLLVTLGQAKGRNVRFLSLPTWVALLGLRAAERVGAKMGFRSDSLVSLTNFDPDPPIAQSSLGMRFRTFQPTSGHGVASDAANIR
jgi:nucleoside-diphosphate-sugar epimerase